jgi:folate-dependent phosphoribosylglycinamide formyltransferase PurN
MIIGIFGYDFVHYKTNAIVRDTFVNGFSIGAVFLAPKINYALDGSKVSIDEDSKNLEIREFCKINHIPVYRVEHNDTSSIAALVKNHNINIGLIGGAKIIHKATIETFKLGIINYHPGRIPETSGLDSIYRTIENSIPPCVTVHLIDSKVDAGLFVLESIVEVFKDDSIEIISKRILNKQIELNYLTLKGFQKKTFTLPKIHRPRKNNRLSIDQKKEIASHFDNWKNFLLKHYDY